MFKMRQRYEVFKSDDNCEDRNQDHPDPCDCWYFRGVTNMRGVKLTVTRMANLRGSIPVSVGTVEARGWGVGVDTIGGA